MLLHRKINCSERGGGGGRGEGEGEGGAGWGWGSNRITMVTIDYIITVQYTVFFN